MALKNSVYILPQSEASFEDFQWLRGEIVEQGGEATVVEAQFIEGLTDGNAEDLFRNARDAEYSQLADELRVLLKRAKGKLSETTRGELQSEAVRLERQLEDVTAIDFFGASGRETVAGLIGALRSCLTPPEVTSSGPVEQLRETFVGRTWVTRVGIHVDRIGSAWLIRKYIDPEATFKFVVAKGYIPEPGELRFDMLDAEYTHQGDACTFEVLCQRFGIQVSGMQAVAEIIHDIDLKDPKYGRPETEGVAAQIAGLALLHREDTERLQFGGELFDQLLAYFSQTPNGGTKSEQG